MVFKHHHSRNEQIIPARSIRTSRRLIEVSSLFERWKDVEQLQSTKQGSTCSSMRSHINCLRTSKYRIIATVHRPYIYREYPPTLPSTFLSRTNHPSTHHQNQHPRNQRIPQLHSRHSVPSRPMDLRPFALAKQPF